MKSYVKPDLYYEDFELSTHIATCYYDMPNSKSEYECFATAEYDVTHVFLIDTVCEFTAVEDYCYTNGGDGFNIFNS